MHMEKLLLVRPGSEYADEISAYRQESLDDDSHISGSSGLDRFENPLEWIERSRLYESKETLPGAEWVVSDQFMLVRESDSRVLGLINLRHYLNDYLEEYGGHIGYSVRPDERRKGYAKIMTLMCFDRCREIGLERVLVTCKTDNEASRKTIFSLGGVYDRTTHSDSENVDLERYWISL